MCIKTTLILHNVANTVGAMRHENMPQGLSNDNDSIHRVDRKNSSTSHFIEIKIPFTTIRENNKIMGSL